MGKTFKDEPKIADTSRDLYQLMLINGATKANVHKDRKREKNKKMCRNWHRAKGFYLQMEREEKKNNDRYKGWEP
jgi:hypothetical protein